LVVVFVAARTFAEQHFRLAAARRLRRDFTGGSAVIPRTSWSRE